MKLLAQAQHGTIDLLAPAKEQGVGIVKAGTDVTDPSVRSALFGGYVGGLLQAVMVIALLIVLTFLVWGSIEYISAGGEKSKLETARNKITGAIAGLIVLAASLAIFFFIQNLIGVKVFSPASDTTITSP